MTGEWSLVFEGVDPRAEPLREALCTLGNGRFATRGAAEESSADATHYPGTYIAGGYNRLTSIVAGRNVVNEDLVNFPNWLPLSFRSEGGAWLEEEDSEYTEYRQELDLHGGILRRVFTVRDGKGRETRVVSRRIVHIEDTRIAAIAHEIMPLNWSGSIEVRSGLDGGVTNWGVARYRELRGDHLEMIGADSPAPGNLRIHARTVQSRLEVAIAARTTVRSPEEIADEMVDREETGVSTRFRVKASRGCAILVEKTVAICTSRDPALGDLSEDAVLEVGRAPDFEELVASQQRAWNRLWDRFDVQVDVDPCADLSPFPIQLIMRLHAFHLLQTASPETVGLDVSIPARGLHGEAYRGHIFWDEMYVVPFYLSRAPEIARSMLLYRSRRLSEARALAAEEGRRGAMFPWQSGSSGREETQVIHLNPRSGVWDPDRSRLQRHVNAAIAKNVWDYVQATGDRDFLARHGAEMLLEIARFWASMAEATSEGKFSIEGVMGPDEFHEAYPDAASGGLRDNAYTNVMAMWCLETAIRALDSLVDHERKAVMEKMGLAKEETEHWRAIAGGMTLPRLSNGIIAQFDGYGDLRELDWKAYRASHQQIGRMDRILRAEGDSPDRYKVSKQADLCMLFYVLHEQSLSQLLARMGYELTPARQRETIEYYRQRTSHGSTLSHVVFAGILHRIDPSASWDHFVQALRSDVEDTQGGTTPEGIHTAAMAGTVRHIMERCAGVTVQEGQLRIEPSLPEAIRAVRFRCMIHRTPLRIGVDRESVEIEHLDRNGDVLPVAIGGTHCRLQPGARRRVAYLP